MLLTIHIKILNPVPTLVKPDILRLHGSYTQYQLWSNPVYVCMGVARYWLLAQKLTEEVGVQLLSLNPLSTSYKHGHFKNPFHCYSKKNSNLGSRELFLKKLSIPMILKIVGAIAQHVKNLA